MQELNRKEFPIFPKQENEIEEQSIEELIFIKKDAYFFRGASL
jgi:hypothetical protein